MIRAALQELRSDLIEAVLPGLYLAAVALVIFVGLFRPPLHGAVPGMLLLAVVGGVWYLRPIDYRLAAWLLVVGVTVVLGLLIFWAAIPSALMLLALPIGLLVLFHGLVAGTVAAGLRELELEPLPYGTPALVCTVPGTVESADRLGAAEYLVKPVGRNDLLLALQRLTARGHTIRKGLTLMGAWHYNLRDFPAVMQVVQHSPLIEQLVSHTFPMRQVQEAFVCSAGQASAKILLQPWA